MRRMKKLVVLLALVFSIAGCGAFDSLSDGLKHSEEVSADLEKALGRKPLVGFRWSNGFLTSVSVTFEGVPDAKSTRDIVALARASIAQHFAQEPKTILVSFAVPGAEK